MEKRSKLILLIGVFLLIFIIILNLLRIEIIELLGVPILIHFLVVGLAGFYLFPKVSKSENKRKLKIALFFLVFLVLILILLFFVSVSGMACTSISCPCDLQIEMGELFGAENVSDLEDRFSEPFEIPCNSCYSMRVILLTGVFNVFQGCDYSEIISCDPTSTPPTSTVRLERKKCRSSVYFFTKRIYGPGI